MFVNLFQRQRRRGKTTQRLWAQRDPTTRTYKVSADVTRLRHFFTILKIPEELTESKSWFFCVLDWPKRIHTPRSTLEKKRRLRFTRTILRKQSTLQQTHMCHPHPPTPYPPFTLVTPQTSVTYHNRILIKSIFYPVLCCSVFFLWIFLLVSLFLPRYYKLCFLIFIELWVLSSQWWLFLKSQNLTFLPELCPFYCILFYVSFSVYLDYIELFSESNFPPCPTPSPPLHTEWGDV